MGFNFNNIKLTKKKKNETKSCQIMGQGLVSKLGVIGSNDKYWKTI